ncbi:MAG: exosortase/archaeosortase family protein [Verrucomicrobiales bacterium]|nr:exosortase/archaeosortase family protein [Verrucomicrobiales bacterium]
MTRRDRFWIAGLAVLAALIWIRDRTWLRSSEDALPLLLALPLAAWLGRPWRWKASVEPAHRASLAIAMASLALGSALDLNVLLAFGWTAALWAWLRSRLEPGDVPRTFRLLVLPWMAFPWVMLDAQSIGWWFRLSGAWAVEQMGSLAGLSVSRQGTALLVEGLPVSVDAACSGLNVLQSLFVAGSALAYLHFSRSPLYWWNLALLLPAAWLANTLRILAITGAALTWGPGFAMGLFHTWGGLFVLFGMFVVCAAGFEAEQRWWNRREGRA